MIELSPLWPPTSLAMSSPPPTPFPLNKINETVGDLRIPDVDAATERISVAHARRIGLRGPSWADQIEKEKAMRGAEVARTVVEECGFLRIISHSLNADVPILRVIVKNLHWKRQNGWCHYSGRRMLS